MTHRGHWHFAGRPDSIPDPVEAVHVTDEAAARDHEERAPVPLDRRYFVSLRIRERRFRDEAPAGQVGRHRVARAVAHDDQVAAGIFPWGHNPKVHAAFLAGLGQVANANPHSFVITGVLAHNDVPFGGRPGRPRETEYKNTCQENADYDRHIPSLFLRPAASPP